MAEAAPPALGPAPLPSAVFAALGDPTRLALVMRLSGGATLSIAALAGDGHLTRQAVTKHLHVLEGAELVTRRRAGRETLYALRPASMTAARDWLDAIGAQWEAALGRLKAHVEGGLDSGA